MITAMRVSVCAIIYFCNAFCALLETPCHVHFVHCHTGIVEWCIKAEYSPFLPLLMRALFPEAELKWGLRCEWRLEQLNLSRSLVVPPLTAQSRPSSSARTPDEHKRRCFDDTWWTPFEDFLNLFLNILWGMENVASKLGKFHTRTHCLITDGKMVIKREAKWVVFTPSMVVWIVNRRRGRAFVMLLIMRATICRCDSSNVIIFAHLFTYSSDCLLISHFMTLLIISLFRLAVHNGPLYKTQHLVC